MSKLYRFFAPSSQLLFTKQQVKCKTNYFTTTILKNYYYHNIQQQKQKRFFHSQLFLSNNKENNNSDANTTTTTTDNTINNNTNNTNNNNTTSILEEEPTTNNSNNNTNNTNNNRTIKIKGKKQNKYTKTLLYSSLFTLSATILYLLYDSNDDRMNYYTSPTRIMENREDYPPDRKIRVGGIVKENSIQHAQLFTIFLITDLKYDLIIEYKGILPDLFQEEGTVICEGFMIDYNKLKCTNILAKHDQRNGMPPEIQFEVERNRRELERKKLLELQNSNVGNSDGDSVNDGDNVDEKSVIDKVKRRKIGERERD
ncbi:hypothetical protein ABK040_004623 [Willaertia magna]